MERTATKSKKNVKNKENEQVIFKLQNENDILRMKNAELQLRIGELHSDVSFKKEEIRSVQVQIEHFRTAIADAQFTQQRSLALDKRAKIDRLQLLNGNKDILRNKIQNLRNQVIIEEQKLKSLKLQRQIIQSQAVSVRANAEAIKIILKSIQSENDQIKKQNEQFLRNRKIHKPAEQKAVTQVLKYQKQIAAQIQDRIRFLKDKTTNMIKQSKSQGVDLFSSLLTLLFCNTNHTALMLIERQSLVRAVAQKRMMTLFLLRKKYLTFIKSKYMQCLRLKPMSQLNKIQRILSETAKRRTRYLYWRVWRNRCEQNKVSLLKQYSSLHTCATLEKSLTRCNLFACFNVLKRYQSGKESALSRIFTVIKHYKRRNTLVLFTRMKKIMHENAISAEVEASANAQSQMLVMGLCFGGWSHLVQNNKTVNRYIKAKAFRGFCTLKKDKNKRILSQMLSKALIKIKEVGLKSKCMGELKKICQRRKQQSLDENIEKINKSNEEMNERINHADEWHEDTNRRTALMKICSRLQRNVGVSISIWRNKTNALNHFAIIVSMLADKYNLSIGFAWSRLQKERFAALKKSIHQKIKSCEFSYEYLLKQNSHINTILEQKHHQIEKNTFVKVVRNILKHELKLKRLYFYKFLKCGFKSWQVKKAILNSNRIIQHAIKRTVMFMLHYYNQSVRNENCIKRAEKKVFEKMARKKYKIVFQQFKRSMQNNKKLKRILSGVFNRNQQLDQYIGYGKIKKYVKEQQQNQIMNQNNQTQQVLNSVETQIAETQNKIANMQISLKNRRNIFKTRKILALYVFFKKEKIKEVSRYLEKWKETIDDQKRLIKFSEQIERKCKILLQQQFINNLIKATNNKKRKMLKNKLDSYKNECDKQLIDYENLCSATEERSRILKKELQENLITIKQYQQKYDHVVNIKIQIFKRKSAKKFSHLLFTKWKNNYHKFIQKWNKVQKMLNLNVLKQVFEILSKQTKKQSLRLKIKRDLSKIYQKKYRNNAELALKTWRNINLTSRIKQAETKLKENIKGVQNLTQKFIKVQNKYNNYVNFRINDRTLRKIFNYMRQYTEIQKRNKNKQKKLQHWLLKGYAQQSYCLFIKAYNRRTKTKKLLNSYYEKRNKKTKSQIFLSIKRRIKDRKTINNLFLGKFITASLRKLNQQFWSWMGNYFRYNECKALEHQTYRIQRILNNFDLKRKHILCLYIRKWRRNRYQMDIAFNLMRKITRRAMNARVRDLFYTWKQETASRVIRSNHQEEGEIKKRKIEIKRLEYFLEQFKKKKGLLLENQKGDLVQSPRFLQKKQQTIKKNNNLRYKFISRVILSMNGCAPAVKAWNNLLVYAQLRQKLKSTAIRILNRKRRPLLHDAFTIWYTKMKNFRNTFDTMQRTQIIRILNKQKQKIQMEYGKKVAMEETIKQQMRNYKLLKHQQTKKERLAALVLTRNANKVKLYALLRWREVALFQHEHSREGLKEEGESKRNNLEEEINSLERSEEQLIFYTQKLEETVKEALEIAEMVRRITEQRNILAKLIKEKDLTCEKIQKQNQELSSKLYLAQKEAMNLLTLAGEKIQ